ATEEEAGIICRIDISEGDRGPDMVSGLLARDVPGDVLVGRDFVHHPVIVARLRPGDHHLETILRKTEKGIEGVQDFGRVADWQQHLRHEENLAGAKKIPRWRVGLRSLQTKKPR